METSFFVQNHPVEGAIKFATVGEHVRLCCRWPFDRSTDEWINITNNFPLRRYCMAVRRLPRTGKATVRGIKFGSLTLQIMPKNKIQMHVADSNQFDRSSFIFPLNAKPKDLLPVRLRQTPNEL
jgi:hypothetical protein